MMCCIEIQCIRILVVLTAIFTLIQGAGYLGLSIWSILVHKCLQVPTKDPLEKVIYFIYFRDHECGEVIWSTNNQQNILPIMPDITMVALRTFYIFIVYGIISIFWVITSLMVLGSFCSIVNRRAFRVCFLPWLIFIIFGSILDVIATIFFVNDIFYTETPQDTLKYLEVENSAEMLTMLSDYEKYFPTATLRLPLITSRCIIVWFFNVLAVCFSVKLVKRLIKTNVLLRKRSENGQSNTNQQQLQNLRESNGFENSQRHERRTFEPLKSGGSILDPNLSDQHQHQHQLQHQQHQHQHQHHHHANQQTRQTSLLSNRRIDNVRDYNDINDSPLSTNLRQHSSQNQQHQHHQHHQSMQPQKKQHSPSSHENQTNRFSEPPQSRNSYNLDQYRESVTSTATNNNNNNNNNDDNGGIRKPEIRNVNAELRGQLPWSYFGPRSEIKTHITTDKNHEILPPIPVPDYTLHFPKDDRPSVVTDYNNPNRNSINRSGSLSPPRPIVPSKPKPMSRW